MWGDSGRGQPCSGIELIRFKKQENAALVGFSWGGAKMMLRVLSTVGGAQKTPRSPVNWESWERHPLRPPNTEHC